MIKGSLMEDKIDPNISNDLKSFINYLKGYDFSKLKPGKLFLSKIIQLITYDFITYKNNINGFLFCHRNCVDINIIIKGVELIGVSKIVNGLQGCFYNSINDLGVLKYENKMLDYYCLEENDFLIIMPNEAYISQLAYNKPTRVRKLIARIKIT